MKILILPLLPLLCLTQIQDHGTASRSTVALEQQIASQQGRFGALYDHCGDSQEKTIVGGSVTAWRKEIFRGYKGTAQERQTVEAAFDRSASLVMSDDAVCKDWIKQASRTWMTIVQLAQQGTSESPIPQ